IVPPAAPARTSEPCILASVSSTSLVMPLPSMAATPCRRSADSRVGYTRLFGTGRAEMMLTVPLILGSSTKLRPVISETAFTTASMSALTKFSVTTSSAAAAGPEARQHPARKAAILRRNQRMEGETVTPEAEGTAIGNGVGALRKIRHFGRKE